MKVGPVMRPPVFMLSPSLLFFSLPFYSVLYSSQRGKLQVSPRLAVAPALRGLPRSRDGGAPF